MIKNIIFDWSGVIRDYVEIQLLTVNKVFKQFGAKEITLEEFKKEWRQPYMVFYNKYLPDLTLEEETDAYRKAILGCPEAKPFPGIIELIHQFKKVGKKMVVLSSDFSETLLPEIESFGLKNIFDEVITDSHNKEDEIYGLMARNNFKKEETVFVGDSNHEIEVGKKIGIKTIAVTWGFCLEENLKTHNPDFLVRSLKELKDVIL
ncbi:MAG: HAD family hydrolase [Candidatus Paceibacterota bacterium]|jgi:phosphoglycolate phosphatase